MWCMKPRGGEGENENLEKVLVIVRLYCQIERGGVEGKKCN